MASFGEELRRERELRQISLREISEATKINMRFLEALERDDFTHLPGGQFTKGFVRAYSQHIGLDAESMVNAYLYEVERQRSRAETHGAALGVPKLETPAPSRPTRRCGPFLLGGILLAAALVVILLFVWPGWLRPATTPSEPTPASASERP